jgi:hypothetical protein
LGQRPRLQPVREQPIVLLLPTAPIPVKQPLDAGRVSGGITACGDHRARDAGQPQRPDHLDPPATKHNRDRRRTSTAATGVPRADSPVPSRTGLIKSTASASDASTRDDRVTIPLPGLECPLARHTDDQRTRQTPLTTRDKLVTDCQRACRHRRYDAT